VDIQIWESPAGNGRLGISADGIINGSNWECGVGVGDHRVQALAQSQSAVLVGHATSSFIVLS